MTAAEYQSISGQELHLVGLPMSGTGKVLQSYPVADNGFAPIKELAVHLVDGSYGVITYEANHADH